MSPLQIVRLGSPTVAILVDEQQRSRIFTLPAHALVTVCGDPDATGLVAVRWHEVTLRMFQRDLEERGTRTDG